MSDQASVTVVGIGDDGCGLTDEARAVLRKAPVIAGGTRQLALLPELPGRRVRLPAPLLPQLDGPGDRTHPCVRALPLRDSAGISPDFAARPAAPDCQRQDGWQGCP
jgi:hypothetical protein